MKTSELRGLSEGQLTEHLGDLHSEWRNLRFQHASGALERTSELAGRRREIAQLLTIARERELAR